jgi:hypothetical protein
MFVDLLIRKVSVSLQAPQSIHQLHIVHDTPNAHDDSVVQTLLLVTGFAQSQWLIPLETDGVGVRGVRALARAHTRLETLSRIVPSDLRDVGTNGTLYGVSTLVKPPRNYNHIGVLKRGDDACFNVRAPQYCFVCGA